MFFRGAHPGPLARGRESSPQPVDDSERVGTSPQRGLLFPPQAETKDLTLASYGLTLPSWWGDGFDSFDIVELGLTTSIEIGLIAYVLMKKPLLVLFGTALALGFASASVADAATYRETVESPPVVSDPSLGYPLVLLQLGTNVSSLNHVSVQVSGIASNGWWVGDPIEIENPYIGPVGASVDVYLFVGGSLHGPGLPSGGWYQGRVTCTNEGTFSSALTLRPVPGYLVELPNVPDGRLALCLIQWPICGLGEMVRNPYLDVKQVDVQVDYGPAINLALRPADGTLSWSGVPSGGSVETLSASDPNGPWQVERRLPANSGSIALQWPAAETRRFFRLRWLEGSSP